MSLQVKKILAKYVLYTDFFSPLEYKNMLNKLQKKESSTLLLIIITELLSLIIMIKLFSP